MKKIYALILFVILATLGGVGYYLYSSKPVEEPKSIVQSKPICDYSDSDLLTIINHERKKTGVKQVVVSNSLENYAQSRAVSLNGTMDNHDGFYKTDDYLFNEFGHLGENLAGLQNKCITSDAFVRSWMSSTLGHRETMLNSRYDRIGIGYYKGIVVTIYGDLR